jgi:zinc transport system ATP-binding protein
MDSILLQATNLSLQWEEKVILQDITLQVRAGQLVTLIGPNGSGKSTLLKVLLGLINPNQGNIYKAPQLKIGYMPQKLYIDSTLPISVEDFLKLSGQLEPINRVLEQVYMHNHRRALMHTLSGGEFQRVLLAKALLQQPNLLVLDEPVQGVDIIGQTELYRLIQAIRETTGCGVLLVSHDLHFVHAASDQVICLNQHICCQGRPEEVQKNPDYLSLFGHTIATGLALYTHSHDHRHDEACKTEPHHGSV